MNLKDFIQLNKPQMYGDELNWARALSRQNPNMTAYDYLKLLSEGHPQKVKDTPWSELARMHLNYSLLWEAPQTNKESIGKELYTVFPELPRKWWSHEDYAKTAGWGYDYVPNYFIPKDFMFAFPNIVNPTRVFRALAEAYRGPEDRGKPFLHFELTKDKWMRPRPKSAQKTSREKC